LLARPACASTGGTVVKRIAAAPPGLAQNQMPQNEHHDDRSEVEWTKSRGVSSMA